MYIKDGKKIGQDQMYVDSDGNQYPPAAWKSRLEELGITEAPDPFRESEETHYVQEIDESPYVVNTPKPVEEVQTLFKGQIKAIRSAALEKFTKNSGVATVYNLNYEAALLGAANDTTILRNGKTPKGHLTNFGSRINMTASAFAAYIIAENRGASPATAAGIKMDEIEGEYLSVYYAASITQEDVAAYQAYCDARTS